MYQLIPVFLFAPLTTPTNILLIISPCFNLSLAQISIWSCHVHWMFRLCSHYDIVPSRAGSCLTHHCIPSTQHCSWGWYNTVFKHLFLVQFWVLAKTSEVESESEVAQLCPTLCDTMDCSLPGSSLHGMLQARVLVWVAVSFSRGSSQPRDWTWVSHIPGRCFNLWATREDHYNCWLPLTWDLLLLIPKLCDMTNRSGAIIHWGNQFSI